MLNNFWPWSVISALRKDLAATQAGYNRLRKEVDALTLQKMILQEQVKKVRGIK